MSRSVAIVGMGGVFPGSPDMDAFWEMVLKGNNAIRKATYDDWRTDPDRLFDAGIGTPDHVYSLNAAFVDLAHAELDESRLNLLPETLEALDPLFRVGLSAAQRSLLNVNFNSMEKSRVGVIIGNIVLPTEKTSELTSAWLGSAFEEKLTGQLGKNIKAVDTRNVYAAGLPADFIASALGFGGPTFTLDAACASSLYAVKLAADALLERRADAVIAGGLSRPDSLYTQMGFGQLRALSKRGLPSPFDAAADGLVVGEGAGMFVLKRLVDAERDGDEILGILRGAGLSNDMDGSLLAPSSEGQLRAMRAAYEEAGWQAHDVDLIECHATGTLLGDRVEFESLNQLWTGSPEGRSAVIGSVKSNVGHLLTAAGAAALAKTLLAIRHQTLPPTAQFSATPSSFSLSQSSFRILKKAEDWTVDAGHTRKAAVSAFGFGGINAHLLIEELPSSLVLPEEPVLNREPIAVIGLGALSGSAPNFESLRARLLGLTEVAEPVDPRWWGVEKLGIFEGAGYKKLQGFFLSDVPVELGRFRIPPKELLEMLPQQLLMLLAAADAVQDAKLDHDQLAGGVIAGIGLDPNTANFQLRWDLATKARVWAEALGMETDDRDFNDWVAKLADAMGPALNANRTIGALGGMVASRLAREFRFGGPSFTVSCGEHAGLKAVETAMRLLQAGELDMAVTGAVDLAGDVRSALATADRGLSDGVNVSDGAAAFVLKRLADAERDGDHIYAVIDGAASSTGPDSAPVIEQVLQKLFEETDAISEAVGLVVGGDDSAGSLSGSGTEALEKVFTDHSPVFASSVPENGFSGVATGAMDLLKAILALEHRVIPAFQGRREEPAGSQHPTDKQPGRSYPWLREKRFGARRAVVMGQGIGGGTTGLMLRENKHDLIGAGSLVDDEAFLFFVEGNSTNELADALSQLGSAAELESDLDLKQFAASRPRKPKLKNKLAISLIAEDMQQLRDLATLAGSSLREFGDQPHKNRAFSAAKRRGQIQFASEPVGDLGKIAFVYPGSGSHFDDMGRALAMRWPEAFLRQDAFSSCLANQIRADKFWSGAYPADIDQDHRTLLTSQVSLGICLSDLVRQFGVSAKGYIGYSLGETASLLSSGVWRDRDALHRRTMDSDLFTKRLGGECQAARELWRLPADEPVDWSLGVINRGADEVKAVLQTGFDRAYLLIVNTPEECVVGGQRSQVEALVERLGAQFYSLGGVVTVHCPVAELDAEAYRNLHLFDVSPVENARFYSCAWGQAYEPTTDRAADSILAQALHGVDYPKTIEAAYADGFRVFIEIGPGSSCTRMIRNILGDRPHLATALTPPTKRPVRSVLRLLGELIAQRVDVDLDPLFDRLSQEQQVDTRPTVAVPVGSAGFDIPAPPASEKKEKTVHMSTKPSKPEMPSSAELSSFETTSRPESRPKTELQRPALEHPSQPLSNAEVMAAKLGGLTRALEDSAAATRDAHGVFLRISEENQRAQSELLSYRMSLLTALEGSDVEFPGSNLPTEPSRRHPEPLRHHDDLFMDREQCLNYAIGSIADVLGETYAPIDGYPTRVRLPDEPLMLVDRVLRVSGEPMTSGNVVTEHDIHPGAWYLDCGRIPTCIAVEAGQADLFLSGFLGIDFETKGLAVYRLLDAVVTFHRELPGPGEVIHYDIYIDKFWRQGESWFFRFRFDGTVNGEPLLTMREGCAGFFSEAALAAGKGIVKPALKSNMGKSGRPEEWRQLVPQAREAYGEEQVDALRRGDLAGCFGAAFEGLPIQQPLGLPEGRMRLVHRVTDLQPDGGAFGLGFIQAEADIHPDDWFITCHFVDDRVMPGTLMYECCLHTLRVFLYRLGWVGEADSVVCQPVPEVRGRLKCRGQVLETTKVVTYEVTIKELGYRPEPFAVVDALMYADGKPIVEINDMSLRMNGLTLESLLTTWESRSGAKVANPDPVNVIQPSLVGPLFDYDRILAFSVGKPSEAFGDPYRIYDDERVIARLPGPPFLFMSRIVEIDAEPWEMKAGGRIVSEYDVPASAWYFSADRQSNMAFSVLLEAALQPCGWFAGYMGSALRGGDIDLSFRNLGGSAVLHRFVTPTSGRLRVEVDVTRVSQSGGMIIQDYSFKVFDREGPIYSGKTYFGFFSKAALANQVGIREAVHPELSIEEQASAERFAYPLSAPYPDEKMRMIDQITAFLPNGGQYGLGYISGTKQVDADDWFFAAHFYQDPVVPGSLGLESFIQLLKVVAVRRWDLNASAQFSAVALDESHEWVYRGQVVPADSEVTVYAVITRADDQNEVLWADGYLLVDGRTIYQMKGFSLQVLR